MSRSFKPKSYSGRKYPTAISQIASQKARNQSFAGRRTYGDGGISNAALMDMVMPAPRQNKQQALMRQVKALVSGKKRDAADVARAFTANATTQSACLTISTANFPGTALDNVGLLDMDGDECLINHCRIKGTLKNPATLNLTPSAVNDARVRFLAVWYYKPLLVASAGGTLPPITEVLITDAIDSLPVTDAANSGRFTVLSDRTFNCGTNTYQSGTAEGHSRVNGKNTHEIDYTIKVDKKIHFAAPAVSGGTNGHYDSDEASGRIDKGLFVLYILANNAFSSTSPIVFNGSTRLNYTG